MLLIEKFSIESRKSTIVNSLEILGTGYVHTNAVSCPWGSLNFKTSVTGRCADGESDAG